MNSAIGANIKRVRRAKGVTQEELATHLGLSCQAISKWERGESNPDISLLVPLANYLGTSSDELLGLNSEKSESIIREALRDYARLDAEGDDEQKYALLLKAYTSYPNDYRLISLYIDFLCCDPEVEDGLTSHRLELYRLCRDVLDNCPIEAARARCRALLAELYYNDGEDAKALEVLSAFPASHQTSNSTSALLLDPGSPERLKFGRRNLTDLLENLLVQTRYIALEDTDFNRVDQLTLLKRAVAMIDLFFPDNDYGVFHYHLSDFYFWMANRYVMTENPAAAIEQIKKAFAHAKAYDELPETFTYTSPLLRGVVFNRGEHGTAGHENKVESQLFYLEKTCAKLYAPLMEQPALKAVVDPYRG